MTFNAQDSYFMARAIHLARQGWYTTKPNPRVGCVIVRNNQIIAEGWHVRAGEAHAEVNALKQAASAEGATVYVTLEPCSHFGKTPPCCEALIEAKVSKVIVAMSDSNPLVSGGGLQRLKESGIEVQSGLMEAEAKQLNPGFIKRMTLGLPRVRSKLAMTLDGRTALSSGISKWITSDAARQDVQRLRAESCAILSGIETVLVDNPMMTARVDFEHQTPLRVILDSQLRMPLNAKMRQFPGRILILTVLHDEAKIAALTQAGFEVFVLPSCSGRLDLQEVLRFLGQQQCNEVLVEAGPILNGALLQQGLVDEAIIYAAPKLMGSHARGLFSLPDFEVMQDLPVFSWQDFRMIGSDLRLTIAFH